MISNNLLKTLDELKCSNADRKTKRRKMNTIQISLFLFIPSGTSIRLSIIQLSL